MKKIKLASVLLGLSLYASLGFADIALQSSDELTGSWKLEYTKKNCHQHRHFAPRRHLEF